MSAAESGDRTPRERYDAAGRYLASIVENSNDAIIGKDLDGTITSWNRGAERMYGYSAEEAVGRPISILVPPEIENDVPAIIERLRRGERLEHYETTRMARDGRRLDVSLTISPIRGPDGSIIGASKIARDVTAHKRMEAELRRAKRRAEEASDAKSRFLAVMSHELRTPLSAILGYAALLEDEVGGPLNDTQRMHVERLRESGRHLVGLIDRVLSFSRIEAGREPVHPEPFDPAPLARDAADMIRPLAERERLGFAVELPGSPVRMTSDPGKVRQILLNLLSNAVKFTEVGEVRLRLRADDDHAVFQVADTGPGIAPDDRERIFRPFERVGQGSRTPAGTGLGLGVSLELARLLGGDLTLESEVGRGSTFTVRLPRTWTEAAERPPGSRRPER